MLIKILEFSPPISDICLYCHFYNKLNLQFSELNITPSVRPNLGIFKNFWYWISIFRQSLLVKKTQFELNLTSFKWALPRSALTGLPRLGWENLHYDCFTHFSWDFPTLSSMLKNQCTYIDDGCFLSRIECTTASLHSKAKFENNMVLRSLSVEIYFVGPKILILKCKQKIFKNS